MKQNKKDILLALLHQHDDLGISQQIDYDKLRIPVDTRSPIPVISVQSVSDLQYRRQS